ncbi:hypothetical protein TcasGA2_TC035047, partial [Tribolium castaneum]
SSSTTTSKKLSFRYSIQNIPAPLATQKSFYSHLISLGLHQIDSLKVNYNKSALLVLSRQLTPNQISTLQAGFPGSKIQFKLLNPTRLLPQIEPKPITFSIVVRDVSSDIEPQDVISALNNFHIQKVWRIISAKTNKPTPLMRIVTPDKTAIDTLLSNGLSLFGHVHPCEPSHPPKPAPLQCAKCFTFGHSFSQCPNKPICPTCPDNHRSKPCPSAVSNPKCPKCQGNHPAWSRDCPQFIKPSQMTPETPVVPS